MDSAKVKKKSKLVKDSSPREEEHQENESQVDSIDVKIHDESQEQLKEEKVKHTKQSTEPKEAKSTPKSRDKAPTPTYSLSPEQPQAESLKLKILALFSFWTELPINLKKYITIRFGILSVICILFLAISLVLMKERNPRTPSYRVLEQIGEVMGKFPIEDIKIIPADEKCSRGYEKIEIGVWPGNLPGCYCGRYDNKHMTIGKCKESQLEGTSCQTVDKHNREILDTWLSRKICVKRYSDFHMIPSIGESCKQGFKSCNTWMCIPQDSLCPISDFTIVNSPGSDTQPFGSKYYTIKRDNSPALASFGISNIETACLGRHELDPDPQQYMLLNLGFDQCYYGANPSAVLIDTMKEATLYAQNNLAKKIRNLPLYSVITENNYINLFALHRFSLNMDLNYNCYNQDRFTNIMIMNLDMVHSRRSQDAYAKMTLGYMITLCLILVVQAVVVIKGKLMNILYTKIQIYANIPLVLYNAAIFVAYFVGSKDKNSINKTGDDLEYLIKNRCFLSDNLIQAMRDYKEIVIQGQSTFWIKGLVLNILSILLFIFFVTECVLLWRRLQPVK